MAAANTVHLVNNILRFSLLKAAVICFLVLCEVHGTPYRHEEPNWNSRKPNSKNKIVFPSDYPKKPNFQEYDYRPEKHQFLHPVPTCQNTTFCEQPSYYPDDLVNLAVQMDDKFKYSAIVDKVIDSDAESRIDMIDEVPICSSIIQIVYPKTAENWNRRWFFVINHNNFVQGVRIEVCKEKSSRILNGTPAGYDASCKQQYTYRQLAIVLSDGTIKLDAFRFPGGCRGYLKFANFGNRIGKY